MLSKRLSNMYARELLMVGEEADLMWAQEYFERIAADTETDADTMMEVYCVIAKATRLEGDVAKLMKYTTKALLSGGCSEVCLELGLFYEADDDYEEAAIWFYNAAYESQPVLVKNAAGKDALLGLIRCYEKLGYEEEEAKYREELARLLQE